MGAYTDAVAELDPHAGARLPGRAHRRGLPGPAAAGSGGYTYGDFGRIGGAPEVHDDGEIWAQTLWDLRTAVGSVDARERWSRRGCGCRRRSRRSWTCATRSCSPTRPPAARGATRSGRVFAARGMGYFASTIGGDDTAPLEDFSLPPAAGAPRGTISGRVTDAATGQPLAGASVALGSLDGDGRR